MLFAFDFVYWVGGGDADADADVVAIDVVTLKGIRKCESMRSTIDETGFK